MKVQNKDMAKFLTAEGWTLARTQSSHQAWTKTGALRPAILDTNYPELPEQHVNTILRTMGKTRADLRAFLAK